MFFVQGLLCQFCYIYLFKYDEMIILVDENEDEFVIKYFVDKNGFSGGWRGFVIDYQFVDGDVVVFYFINLIIFKV